MDSTLLKDTVAARPLEVLLIEDNLGFCYFVDDALMRKHAGGFHLSTAHDLAGGMAALRKGGVDVVLLDLGLPDSVRFETFQRTFAEAPQTPIIILTVLNDDSVAMQAMRAGAQDYLMKTHVDDLLLVRSIKYAVERGRIDEKVRRLSGRILQLQDEERRRIARDLHDTTAQNLAALCMSLALLQKGLEGEGAQAEMLDKCIVLADLAAEEIRTTAYLLHPPLLEELGLDNAMRDYADGFAKRSGIRVDLELPEASRQHLSERVATTLFRVMQECLSNIHRHAHSKTASITLLRYPTEVVLRVADQGVGLGRSDIPLEVGIEGLGVGIAGMRERLRQLRGSLEIETRGGVIVTARLPLGGDPP